MVVALVRDHILRAVHALEETHEHLPVAEAEALVVTIVRVAVG